MKLKHALIMLACCLIPIVALVLVTVFNIPFNTVIFGLMILACPLSHILMMKFMMQDHDHQGEEKPAATLEESTHMHHESL